MEKPGSGPLKPDWGQRSYSPAPSPSPKTPAYKTPAETSLGAWRCLGVLAGTLKLHGQEHDLPMDAQPQQPTTAADGTWMTGMCETCEKRTVWRKR